MGQQHTYLTPNFFFLFSPPKPNRTVLSFSPDDRKKWHQERKKTEHVLKTMGNFPFVLGLSKKKRVRAISEVLKHREKQIRIKTRSMKTRPSSSKPRRKKNNTKLRSISTSQLTTRPGTTSAVATRMSHKSPLPLSPSGSTPHLDNQFTTPLGRSQPSVSFGLDGTEPMNDDISANDLAKIQEIQREECQYFSEEQMAQISPLTETITNSTVEEQQQVVEVEAPPSPRSPPSTNEILFDLIDTDHDGVVTKDDLVVGVTENIEVQSMLEAEGSILFYDPSDAKTATVWMDVFDNLITKNVNGNINCAEFSTFMDNLNQIQRQTNAQVAAEVEQQKEEDS